MEKKRYGQIDICKGLGIILVVLGHALKQTGSKNPAVLALIHLIYSFHMPLFFVLSGFVSYRLLELKGGKERLAWTRQRARRLLVPYLVMSLLYIPLKLWMSRYAIVPYRVSDTWKILIGDGPNTVVWFLLILFLCGAAAALLMREETYVAFLSASVLFCAAAYAMDWQIRFPRYFFFFIIGLGIRKYYKSWEAEAQERKIVLASSALFILGNVFGWFYGGLWQMLTAVTGSHLALVFSEWLNWKSELLTRRKEERRSVCGICGKLKFLGRYSMDIYIFSDPVITAVRLLLWEVLKVPALICMLACFVIGLLLPIPVSALIVRRVGWLRAAFLGMLLKKREQ